MIAEGKGAKTIALQLGALGVSIFLCLVAGADIFASRGANYASDLIGKLGKAAGKAAEK